MVINDVSLCWMLNYSVEFPAGEVIKCLLGLDNNGKNDFIVEVIEASLRWLLLKIITKLTVLSTLYLVCKHFYIRHLLLFVFL